MSKISTLKITKHCQGKLINISLGTMFINCKTILLKRQFSPNRSVDFVPSQSKLQQTFFSRNYKLILNGIHKFKCFKIAKLIFKKKR